MKLYMCQESVAGYFGGEKAMIKAIGHAEIKDVVKRAANRGGARHAAQEHDSPLTRSDAESAVTAVVSLVRDFEGHLRRGACIDGRVPNTGPNATQLPSQSP